MRCLHVVDALDQRAPVRALLRLLRAAAPGAAFDPVVHDVLALASGPLEPLVRTHARRLTLVTEGLEVPAAILGGGYDVVHVLDRSAARTLAPLLTSGTAATFVYSAPALDARPGPPATEVAERAVLASCDLVVHAPVGGRAPELTEALVHRSVCLELARLTEPGAVADGDFPGDDDLEPLFIAREWAAVLYGTSRAGTPDGSAEAVHP